MYSSNKTEKNTTMCNSNKIKNKLNYILSVLYLMYLPMKLSQKDLHVCMFFFSSKNIKMFIKDKQVMLATQPIRPNDFGFCEEIPLLCT
jgi:hypothetical protein